MPKKLSLEFVQEQVRKAGHEPYFEEYINAGSPLRCVCKKHGEFYISYSNLKKIIDGKFKEGFNGCSKCRDSVRRTNIEHVQKQIMKLGHIPLFKTYKNGKSPLLCKCKIHGEFYITYDKVKHLINGKSPNANGCTECWREMQRHPIEEIIKIFKSQGLTPLFNEYKSLRDRVQYICNKHPEEGIQHTEIQCVFLKNTVCKKCKSEKRSAWQTKYTKEEMVAEKNARRCVFYFDWKKRILKRDNYSCQKCGSNKELKAHHILNFKTHVELRYKDENGIILCEECHKKFHSKYGNKINNLEQLKEFLGENSEE